jgi:hypothetical protein
MTPTADSGRVICTCLPLPDGVNEACPEHGSETLEDAFCRMWEHEAYLRDHFSGPIADRFYADLRRIEAATHNDSLEADE